MENQSTSKTSVPKKKKKKKKISLIIGKIIFVNYILPNLMSSTGQGNDRHKNKIPYHLNRSFLG